METRRVVVMFELDTNLPLKHLRKLVRVDFDDVPSNDGRSCIAVFLAPGSIPERATVRLAEQRKPKKAKR